MPDALYFAYGSNLDPRQMQRRCPSARQLAVAALTEHQLEFTVYSERWGGGAADVLPEANGCVWGALYRIEILDLATLDRFEGNYARVESAVQLSDGSSERAFLYRAERPGRFDPSRAYLDTLLRGARLWGLPEAYWRALETRRTHENALSPSAEPLRPR